MTNISIQEVFKSYEEIYEHILNSIYPSKGSTGFSERNLSVNFSKAYEQVAKNKKHDAVSWFEFQFGNKNRNHVDLVMLDNTSKELFIVESKRFSNPKRKMKEMGWDIERIYSLQNELNDQQHRINMNEINHVYGVILADVWLENPLKCSIYKSYINKSFLSDYANELDYDGDLEESYFCQDVIGKEEWLKGYKLISFIWELKDK